MNCFEDIGMQKVNLTLNNMANYLKYTKLILDRMSFCPKLLNKEYRKCVVLLSKHEIDRLHNWIRRQKFSTKLEIHLSK